MEAPVHVVHFSARGTVGHLGEHFEVAARFEPLTGCRAQIALLKISKFGRTVELHQSAVENRVPKLQRVACAVGALPLLLLLGDFFFEPSARLNPDRDSDAHVLLRDRNQFHCWFESGHAFVAQVR